MTRQSPALTAAALFRVFNAAIARAHDVGDDHGVSLLLAAKLAAVRYHHGETAAVRR